MHTREHDLAEAEPPALVPAGQMAKKVCTKPDWSRNLLKWRIYIRFPAALQTVSQIM